MFEGLFQPMDLLVILIVVLLVFGSQKLQELGKGLGGGMRGGPPEGAPSATGRGWHCELQAAENIVWPGPTTGVY